MKNITFSVRIQLTCEDKAHRYRFDDVGLARFLLDWGLVDRVSEVDRLMVGRSVTTHRNGLEAIIRRVGIWN